MKMMLQLKRRNDMAANGTFWPTGRLVAILAVLLFASALLLVSGSRADDSQAILAPEPAYQVDVSVEKEELIRKMAELREKNAELKRAIEMLSKKIEPLEPKSGQAAPDRSASGGAPNYLYKPPISVYKLPKKVTFAGREVPLDKWDVRERLEFEFYRALGDEGRLLLLLKKNKRYFPFIEKELKENGLPQDLKYVAVVESSLNERAYSSAGAVGVWQFIRRTGRRYGLEKNRWKDERRDLEKATDSAMSYLKNLYSKFGDWPLALAAYNAGEARVERELADQKVDNYYQLALPMETERYVFKIIATKLILSEPERYGLLLDDEEYFLPKEVEKVKIKVTGRSVHLRQIAEAAGSYFREIKRLNPEILGDYLPRGGHYIFIPKAGAKRFLKNFNGSKDGERDVERSIHEKRPSAGKKINYVVRRGDTLWGIASSHDVELSRLLEWNRLDKKAKIKPGQRLVIYK